MRTSYPVERGVALTGFYTLFLADFPLGYSFAGEFHDFWECLYVIRGGLRVSADGRIDDLPAGSMIFHKPMEIHKFSVTDPGGASVLIATFDMTGGQTAFFRDKVFLLPTEARRGADDLVQYLAAHEEYRQKNYHKSFLSPERAPNLALIAASLERIFLLLLGCDALPARHGSEEPDDAAVFSRAVCYIEEHLFRPLPLEEVARHCNISVSGLKRLFRKYTDLGVHEYYLNLKFREALKLLKAGERVTDAAERLGFSSQSYFSKSFKRVMGFSPSDVERML